MCRNRPRNDPEPEPDPESESEMAPVVAEGDPAFLIRRHAEPGSHRPARVSLGSRASPAPPSNAEPDVLLSNLEPDLTPSKTSPSKSWSNRMFKSVKRTLWSGRASSKRGNQSAVDSSASDNGDASVGYTGGPAGPEENVDIIDFLVDEGRAPSAKPSPRPTDLPETVISSYFAGTDPMEDGWLMSSKTLGSGSSVSPGQLPTRTAHDERLRLRNELKAAESVLEQKVKAIQDVKIRAEAIRSERGASRKAAADARKAADADKAAGAVNSARPTRRKRAQQQPAWKLAVEKEKEEKRAARKADEDLKAVAFQEVAEKRALRKRNKDLRAGKVCLFDPTAA